MRNISDEMEEAFFERYFEYGDDSETTHANLKKACYVMKKAHEEAERITALVENGECFDESQAILAFQTLALAKNSYEGFLADIPENERAVYQEMVRGIIK